MNEAPLRAVRILGTGEYVPERIVLSVDFDRRWNKPAGWTERQTGVASRRHAGSHETSSIMGARAAIEALNRAETEPGEIDCIISACSVMEQTIPCNAVLIHRELGLQGSAIPAFDVNATCLSFLVAFDTAANAIAVRGYRRVLIVSSEIASCGLDWNDVHTAPLFGDGAAAVVLGSAAEDEDSAVLASHFETYSEGADHCQVRSGGTRLRIEDGIEPWLAGAKFEMQGRATYRLAAERLPKFIERLFDNAGIALPDVGAIVPHQASGLALSHLEHALALPADRLIRILESHGNQIAASIPAALHHAVAVQGIDRGQLLALIGSGAGLSLGGMIFRY